MIETSPIRIGVLVESNRLHFENQRLECVFLKKGFYKDNGLNIFAKVGDKVAFLMLPNNMAAVLGAIGESWDSRRVCLSHNNKTRIEVDARAVELVQGSTLFNVNVGQGSTDLRNDQGSFIDLLKSWLDCFVQSQGTFVQTFLGPGCLNPGVVAKASASLQKLEQKGGL